MRADDVRQLLEAIRFAEVPAGMTARIVAVDGPGGAGKSSLARRIAHDLEAPVIHTDDFASWENPVDWWPELLELALEPLAAGRPARYQPTRWGDEERRPIVVEPTEIVVLEGVTASRQRVPALSRLLDLDRDSTRAASTTGSRARRRRGSRSVGALDGGRGSLHRARTPGRAGRRRGAWRPGLSRGSCSLSSSGGPGLHAVGSPRLGRGHARSESRPDGGRRPSHGERLPGLHRDRLVSWTRLPGRARLDPTRPLDRQRKRRDAGSSWIRSRRSGNCRTRSAGSASRRRCSMRRRGIRVPPWSGWRTASSRSSPRVGRVSRRAPSWASAGGSRSATRSSRPGSLRRSSRRRIGTRIALFCTGSIPRGRSRRAFTATSGRVPGSRMTPAHGAIIAA